MIWHWVWSGMCMRLLSGKSPIKAGLGQCFLTLTCTIHIFKSKYRIMYVLAWRTVYALTRGLFWCLFPEKRSNEGNKHQITLEWAHKQFVTRVHTLFYFLHDITNPKMTLKTRIFTNHPRVLLARFTLCWWRHNRLLMTSQWPDNCDAITWIVISYSLKINFLFTAIFTAGRVRSPST